MIKEDAATTVHANILDYVSSSKEVAFGGVGNVINCGFLAWKKVALAKSSNTVVEFAYQNGRQRNNRVSGS
jgi:hypothetical protein